jgi:hypothetical protein
MVTPRPRDPVAGDYVSTKAGDARGGSVGHYNVANYGDGTVSEVDLNAMRVIGTAAVGGHPTSVSTASDGSVWLGGNGYIAKLNGSLSSIRTYSTGGKTVLALQVSDGVSELAATMADANGNVFLDEVNITPM